MDGIAKLIRDELLLDRDVADHKYVAWLYQDPLAQGPADPAAAVAAKTLEKRSAP